jgi:hypothetical protein
MDLSSGDLGRGGDTSSSFNLGTIVRVFFIAVINCIATFTAVVDHSNCTSLIDVSNITSW